MTTAVSRFNANIAWARSLGALATGLATQLGRTVDLDDILRAQLVFAVSALDRYVHEAVCELMVMAARKRRRATDHHRRFAVSIGTLDHATGGADPDVWLRPVIEEKHSWLAFQQPDKIADAVRLVHAGRLWEQVSAAVGMPPRAVKTQLKTIVDRRNKIVHEADENPLTPGARWPISPSDADDATAFIGQIVNAIDGIIS